MRKMLKRWEKAALIALSFTLLSAAWTQRTETERSGKVLRLHVVAASDSAEEQAIKLRVRDAVLACLAPMLEGASDTDRARECLSAGLERIADAAASEAQDRRITVSLGPRTYGSRATEGGVLPAGTYQTLCVTVGEGRGHNWWGILFPQLCLPAVKGGTEEALETLRQEGVLLLPEEEGYELRLFLLDWWTALKERGKVL